MTDTELISACVSGDKGARETLVADYSRLVYSGINTLLGIYPVSGPPLNADDIYQELMIDLFKDDCRKLGTFRGRNGASLATWLRTVTINFTVTKLRRQGVRVISLDDESEAAVAREAAVSLPSDPEPGERLKALGECIESLNIEDRYFMELYLNQELSLNELHRFMGISRGALDMRKKRLMQRLRNCFKRKGYFLKTG